MLKIENMMGINVDFLQWFKKNLINKLVVVQLKKIIPNQQLGEELHKTIIRKFEKQKVQSSFICNI